MKAIPLYVAAYFSDPLDLRCIYNMAQCMLLDGKVQDAIETFEVLMTYKDRKHYKHCEVIDEAAFIVANLKENQATKKDSKNAHK